MKLLPKEVWLQIFLPLSQHYGTRQFGLFLESILGTQKLETLSFLKKQRSTIILYYRWHPLQAYLYKATVVVLLYLLPQAYNIIVTLCNLYIASYIHYMTNGDEINYIPEHRSRLHCKLKVRASVRRDIIQANKIKDSSLGLMFLYYHSLDFTNMTSITFATGIINHLEDRKRASDHFKCLAVSL